jgi:hypothetical protein
MDIHSKKWKMLLKKTRITAEAFIDEIRGNLEMERGLFRFVFCSEEALACKEQSLYQSFAEVSMRKGFLFLE